MSNEKDQMTQDPANNNATPDVPAAADLPQTPDEIMQAATARIADLEAELAELREELSELSARLVPDQSPPSEL